MQKTLFVVFTRNGYDRTVVTEPVPKTGEYCVGVTIKIPDAVFKRPPMPMVEVSLAAGEVGTAQVSVDGERVTSLPVDEAARKQAAVQAQLAQLFEAARVSTDPAMQGLADVVLQRLVESGVDVKIVAAEVAVNQEGGER